MSAQPEEIRAEGPTACPVCGTPVADSLTRCPECGYALAGFDGRPSAYSRSALWWTVAGFVAVYAIIVLVVALAN